jgi:hypothetical protein
MSIIRVKKGHKKPYVIIDTTAINDDHLSFRAKGLHTYLMAKPDDWHVYIEQLEALSPREGRDAIRAALKELEIMGYIKREKIRDEKGRMAGWNTVVYETPAIALEEEASPAEDTARIGLVAPPKSDEPKSDEPKSDEPKSDEPKSANPQLLSIDLNQELKIVKIEENSPSLISPAQPAAKKRRTTRQAPAYTPGFLDWWSAYPVDRRREQENCFTVWTKEDLEPRAEELVAKLERLKVTEWNRSGTERQYIKTSLPYLNAKRYNDDLLPLDSRNDAASQLSANGLYNLQVTQQLMEQERLREQRQQADAVSRPR